MIYRVIISRVCRPDATPKRSPRGPLYAACFNAETIVAESTEPFLDACRVLEARGLSGTVEMWDDGRPFPRMQSTIEAAARLTVKEGDRRPRFGKWRPHPHARMPASDEPVTVDGQNAFGGTDTTPLANIPYFSEAAP